MREVKQTCTLQQDGVVRLDSGKRRANKRKNTLISIHPQREQKSSKYKQFVIALSHNLFCVLYNRPPTFLVPRTLKAPAKRIQVPSTTKPAASATSSSSITPETSSVSNGAGTSKATGKSQDEFRKMMMSGK
jgi:hypothetical protein